MNGSKGKHSVICRLAGAIVLLAIIGGCDESAKDAVFAFAIVAGIAGVPPTHAKPAKHDHILQVRSAKSDSGFEVRSSRELWKPFRFEASLGLPDGKHADLGANGSFGVTVENAAQFIFYSFDVTRSGQGIVVTAGAGGLQQPAALTIPDSLAADVAIEDTGTAINFYARKHGDVAYTPVGSVAATAAGPFQFAVDASGLPKGTVLGYDFVRVTTNGAPPSPTPAQTLRETIHTAIDAMAEAIYAMDDGVLDRTKAGDQLDLAVSRLNAALAMDLSAFKTTRTKATSARKKTAALVAGTRGKKSANSVISALLAISKLAQAAADAAE